MTVLVDETNLHCFSPFERNERTRVD